MSDNAEAIKGPLWANRNWAIDAGKGSIHDDDTAEELGFRGGTVPGDVHMNQFVPVVLERFGRDWFSNGHLSLIFKNATVDGEPVRAIAEPIGSDGMAAVRGEREDGMLVCVGSAGLGDYSQSAMRTANTYPCEPEELSILRRVKPGISLGDYDIEAKPTRQFELLEAGLISDALDDYRIADDNGQVIACPSTIVQHLWGIPMDGLRPLVEDAVGLFGAIEFGFDAGPWRLPGKYTLRSHVVSLGQSPKTENLWFETRAFDSNDVPVVTFRMMLRFVKGSST